MIVAMQEKATEDQIDAVIAAMVEVGVNVHRTTGATQSILAGVGPTANVDLRKFELLPACYTCTGSVRRTNWRDGHSGRKARGEFPNGVTVAAKRLP